MREKINIKKAVENGTSNNKVIFIILIRDNISAYLIKELVKKDIINTSNNKLEKEDL